MPQQKKPPSHQSWDGRQESHGQIHHPQHHQQTKEWKNYKLKDNTRKIVLRTHNVTIRTRFIFFYLLDSLRLRAETLMTQLDSDSCLIHLQIVPYDIIT